MKVVNYMLKHKVLCLFILLAFFFILRLLFLDCDLPPTGIINYQPIDEGAYSYLSLNKLNYGIINPDAYFTELQQYTSVSLRFNLIGNLCTYLGMLIFGKNYFGLRIGSVLCVLFAIYLIYKILVLLEKKYNYDQKNYKPLMFFIIIYIICEFTFLIASRVNETSIYRMLFVILTLYFYLRYDNVKIKFFLISFFSVFSITGIYLTNIFLVVAVYAVTIAEILFKKKEIKNIIIYTFLGSFLAFLISEIYLNAFWDSNFIKSVLSVYKSYNKIDGYSSVNSIYSMIKISIEFISNNFFLYNLPLIFSFFIGIPYLLKKIIKSFDLNIIFMIFIIGAYYCQTLFSPDFVRRKFIMVVPIIIFLFFIIALLRNKYSIKMNSIYKVYCVACFFICIGIIAFRLYITNDGSRMDFKNTDIFILTTFSLFSLILILINVLKCNISLKKVLIVYMTSLFINLYMDLSYVYMNPTYSEKQIMIDLEEMDLKPKYIVGTYMLGYSLYNEYIPILNTSEQMKNILVNNPEFYYLDYATDDIVNLENYLNSFMEGTNYKLVEIKRFSREFQRYGHKRSIGIYKVEKKE